jgi:hypothetical protein
VLRLGIIVRECTPQETCSLRCEVARVWHRRRGECPVPGSPLSPASGPFHRPPSKDRQPPPSPSLAYANRISEHASLTFRPFLVGRWRNHFVGPIISYHENPGRRVTSYCDAGHERSVRVSAIQRDTLKEWLARIVPERPPYGLRSIRSTFQLLAWANTIVRSSLRQKASFSARVAVTLWGKPERSGAGYFLARFS